MKLEDPELVNIPIAAPSHLTKSTMSSPLPDKVMGSGAGISVGAVVLVFVGRGVFDGLGVLVADGTSVEVGADVLGKLKSAD